MTPDLPGVAIFCTPIEGRRGRGEIEKFIVRQPPMGEKDDYDSENSWSKFVFSIWWYKIYFFFNFIVFIKEFIPKILFKIWLNT